MTTRTRRLQPAPLASIVESSRLDASADVFSRTVPLVVERHFFGETKKASLAPVRIEQGEAATETDKRLLTLSKRLLDSAELRAIKLRDTRFREYLQAHATPWRPGMYLVPFGMVETVHGEAGRWERERQALVDAAAAAYPGHVEAMRGPLGPLFNPLDYPSVAVFRTKFWVDWRFIDMGVPNVLRQFRADVFAREEEALRRQASAARQMVEQHLRASLLEITRHLAELLQPSPSGKKRTLRDGVLDRLNEYLATVESRNITNDGELRRVTERLRRLGAGLSVEALRDDEDLRARAAEEMVAVQAAVAELVEDAPERAIRIREEVGA
jgi:hypothetical protein